MPDYTGETTALLQQLIRNECVNDNSPDSGHEARSVAVLKTELEGSGLDIQMFESAPERQSLVARIEGSDPTAPSLLLMGHLDVVPVNPDGWHHDPFGGELIDDVVWGRGAVDMLNLTSSMAVTMKRLAAESFRPRGTLIYLAVADEESGGSLGAGWLTEHERDAVQADYVISEWGGVPIPSPNGSKLWITTGQKGGTDIRLTVRGVAGHSSMPLRADNALVKAARVVQRLASARIEPEITDAWRAHVAAMEYDADFTATLLDPARLDDALDQFIPALAKRAHACTRTTISPTVIHGGTASNVIPDTVEISVLVRRLPGHTQDDVMRMIDDALGDLRGDVDIHIRMEVPPTQSAFDTPLTDVLRNVSNALIPGSSCVPELTPGGNDLGFFRQLGSTAYGFGLLSDALGIDEFFNMWHGPNERIDIRSLDLCNELWYRTAKEFLS